MNMSLYDEPLNNVLNDENIECVTGSMCCNFKMKIKNLTKFWLKLEKTLFILVNIIDTAK